MSTDHDALQALTFKLKLILRQSRPAYLAVVANSLFYLYCTKNEPFRLRVYLWAIAINLVTLARYLVTSRWNMEAAADLKTRRRQHLMVSLGAAASGLLWGVIGWNYFDTSSAEAQSISLFLLAGMTAGAVGAYSHSLPTLYSYLLPAMLPLIVRALSFADIHHLTMALAAVLYIALLIKLGQNSSEATSEAIQLSFQNELLEAERRASSRLLANVSHEIRTPLTAIIGYVDLLVADETAKSKDNESLSVIKKSSEHLLTMVNDLLDISRLSAGKVEPARSWFSPAEEVEHAIRLTAPMNSSSIPIEVKTADDVPPQIYSDAKLFRQVIINLLSNAIKFTPHGSIEVSLHSDTGSGPGRLVIDVTDTGIGLDTSAAQRVFQPFSRSLDKFVQGKQGTGLGLALSKDLAHLLGGDLNLKTTTVGRGSTFSFSVDTGNKNAPALTPELARPSTDDTLLLKNQLSGHSVLVVDDTPELLTLISRILNRFGLKVDQSNSGVDAIYKASHKKFDLILMDLSMPGIDGFQAAQEIRRTGFLNPILALTAHGTEEHQVRCLKEGFNAFLQKPIDQKQLLRSLARWTPATPPAQTEPSY